MPRSINSTEAVKCEDKCVTAIMTSVNAEGSHIFMPWFRLYFRQIDMLHVSPRVKPKLNEEA